MAVMTTPSTLPGGVTPICNDCGVTLCWDIDDDTYRREQPFWDAWRCRDCDPHAIGSRRRSRANQEVPHATQ